jgi:hypothetical protein
MFASYFADLGQFLKGQVRPPKWAVVGRHYWPLVGYCRTEERPEFRRPAALRRELAAAPIRGWHVNADPAFVSLRLDAGTMPGAEASARPVSPACSPAPDLASRAGTS